jgi:integrase
LRRFFASELLGQDAGISDVKELLGHASNETTAIYDRRAERAKQKTACSQAETLGSTRPAKNQTLSVIPLHND